MAGDVNLNRLAVFSAVVHAGSFTQAAERLGMTKAMVSQHLSKLEAELGVSLLARSTRRMALTEAGRVFHADCERILSETEAAIDRASSERHVPQGALRVTASVGYGVTVIAPALASFLRRYPQVQAELMLSDQIVDLIAQRFDLAIRGGQLRDSRLRATRLAGFRQQLVAAPSYLQARGIPKRPQDLSGHDAIVLTALSSPMRWTFTARNGTAHQVQLRGRAQADSAAAVQAMALAGAGAAILPDFTVADDLLAGRLQLLLPSYRLPERSFHAVYATERPAAKVRLFIDHLRQELANAAVKRRQADQSIMP